jgi:endonuclease-3 related protein
MRETGLEEKKIQTIFRTLEAAMGPQHWWPAGSPFEVVVGAFLTQNTAWTNVERALGNLREAAVLSISGVRNTPLEELEQMVRPAGYFRQKAARLKRFVTHLDASHSGSLDQMFTQPLEALREELLGLPGIGPETADSILLYAAGREVFVVDAYARRIFERHTLIGPDVHYDQIRLGVERALAMEETPLSSPYSAQPSAERGAGAPMARRSAIYPPAPHTPSAASTIERSELSRRYSEFHALIVQTAKHFCVKAAPRCEGCPLRPLLPPKRRSR